MVQATKRVTGSRKNTAYSLFELVLSIGLLAILLSVSAGFIVLNRESEIEIEAKNVAAFFASAYQLAATRQHPTSLKYRNDSIIDNGDQALSYRLSNKVTWRWRIGGSNGPFQNMETFHLKIDNSGTASPTDLQLSRNGEFATVALQPFAGRPKITYAANP